MFVLLIELEKMSFASALMSEFYDMETENGAVSHSTSGDARVNLFFKMCRGMSDDDLATRLTEAYAEDKLDTIKIIFNTRDCRGGKGERDLFVTAMRWLHENDKGVFLKNVEHTVEYGRWDDLLRMASFGDDVGDLVSQMFASQLVKDLELLASGEYGVSLCAKWAPTEGKRFDREFGLVKSICRYLKCDNRTYRKTYLTPLREWLKIVEKFMCSKDWDKIDYSKVPSRAMMRLKKAFQKNDTERFEAWKSGLVTGTTKVNSSQVFPHELCMKYYSGADEDVVTEKQWEGLVTEAKEMGTFSKALVISDVSDSMTCDGGVPMGVSLALGIMISELCKGVFNGSVITFSAVPEFFKLDKNTSLRDRCRRLMKAPWGMNTDFQKVLDMILKKSVAHGVSPEEMPKTLFVISDMQFDACGGGGTNFDVVKAKYKSAGYDMPQIVFWNVHGRIDDSPVKFNDKGVCLVSGFSPAIMKSVLNANTDTFTPLNIMKLTIDDERYARLTV